MYPKYFEFGDRGGWLSCGDRIHKLTIRLLEMSRIVKGKLYMQQCTKSLSKIESQQDAIIWMTLV